MRARVAPSTDKIAVTNITLFDLDHTLLPLDTNQAWIDFLVQQKALDASFLSGADAMKQRYLAGGDDPDVPFCEFFIDTLTRYTLPHLLDLRERFIAQIVKPHISDAARALVAQHRHECDQLAIITATNEFITAPIAAAFDIPFLIATRCEVRDGLFTGHVLGLPSMRSGKVTRMNDWLESGVVKGVASRSDVKHLRFYSDSINDCALLQVADEAIAVNPDPALERLAKSRGWRSIKLY